MCINLLTKNLTARTSGGKTGTLGVHNILRVRVCTTHMGGHFGPKFSKQGFFLVDFPEIGWFIKKLAKNIQKWVVFRQNSSQKWV